MRKATLELMKMAKQYLTDSEAVKAQDLSNTMHIPLSSVFRVIRALREQGVGVHTCKRGYVLSEFATKKDDVNFLRRLSGRRMSDYVAIKASQPHITPRWNGLEDQRLLKLLTAPLTSNIQSMKKGLTMLADMSTTHSWHIP